MAALLAVCGVLAGCAAERGPRVSGPLDHRAYVWQRRWTPAVAEAVRGAATDYGLTGLTVLAAEVGFEGGRMRTARAAVDWGALADAGGRAEIAVALRIGRFGGRFAAEPETVDRLARLAAATLDEARAGGVEPAALEVDFDAATAALADYAVLLDGLRRAAAPLPLRFTALPTWLGDRRGFAALADAADGFVLQVHSLEPPAGPDDPVSLCDPAAARRAVERAAELGRPFRVALPTYAYLLSFDAGGRMVGIDAEDVPDPTAAPGQPGGMVRRMLAADPEAMAGLVREWTASRPAALTGVVWYRLPTRDDRRNWPAATLRAVIAGRGPEPVVEAAVRLPDPRLAEIDLVNPGEAAAPAPRRIEVRWRGGAPLAADAVAGYRLARLEAGVAELRLAAGADAAAGPRPGERRTVAWLRFTEPPQGRMEAEVLPEPEAGRDG